MSQSQLARAKLIQTGIQEVLDFEGITEVAINQPNYIWFDKGNGWEFKNEPRCDLASLEFLATSLSVYSNSGQNLDFNNPITSVILPDGERGQIIMAPATETGCVSFTFRKPSLNRFTLDNYLDSGRLSDFILAKNNVSELKNFQKKLVELKNKGDMGAFFRLAIQNKQNILLVGGTGSGKTTFMKALADLYPTDRRIFTIEDVHELDLPNHPNHLHLFYKAGGVTPKHIIESCMRMKPDHVFLAELRGDEAWNYLELLNTGHDGSLTTTHANDCLSAISRLGDLVKQSSVGLSLDYDFIISKIKQTIDIVCFCKNTYMTELYYNPESKLELMNGI
ncbi:TriJ protein [Yersinia aldovae]|uniref:P-type DNA transfer ATPase VirB11 n=1 Tax=Yersinia aldovae TaxID=29483 RepID=UPI0005DC038B|nr:P-type DNA transfer ATPase VirB11 [Yersinia aldovae]CNK25607.1 TriJ protein [Yersinia aldovae]